MKLEITDEQIIDMCMDKSVYFRGYTYFINGRVEQIDFSDYSGVIEGIVIGSRSYEPKVFYDETGITEFECTCADFASDGTMCKHIVALIKKYEQEILSGGGDEKQKAFYSNTASQMLDDIVKVKVGKYRRIASIKPLLHIRTGAESAKFHLELRIGGNERLYVVRDIGVFLDAVANGEVVEFGKHFTYDSNVVTFGGVSQRLMDLLSITHQVFKQQGSTIGERSIDLEGTLLESAMPIIAKLDTDIYLNNRLKDKMRILTEAVPLEIQVLKEGERYVLDFRNCSGAQPLTEDFSMILWEDDIYILPPEQAAILKIFAGVHKKLGEYRVRFESESKVKLISSVMPKLRYVSRLSIDHAVKRDVILGDLQVKVYLDTTEEGYISARVLFCYENVRFNHFAHEEPNVGSKILIRDRRGENNFIRVAAAAGFLPENGILYLRDDDKIYQFLSDTIKTMQKVAEIYYCENFGKVKIIRPRRGSGSVGMSSGDMLDFSISFDEIAQDELERLLDDIIEKKRYHRLKEGSFIDLESDSIRSMVKIMDNLDIGAKQIREKNFAITPSRAFYLKSAQEEGLINLSYDSFFEDFIQKIKQPDETQYQLPQQLKGKLRDYQVTGFRWLKTLADYHLGGILADEMGLGKTLQAIAFIVSEYEKNPVPSLVIAPTSLIFNWQAEFEKFTSDVKTRVVHGNPFERKEALENLDGVQVVITSYGLLRRDIALYLQHQFNYCFIDEAQHIKNPHTINAKAVKNIKANGFFALTGTPLENNLTELWSIFDFIMPSYLYTRHKFRRLYEVPIIKNEDKKALESLQGHIKPFILRRLKSEVLAELPEKIETQMVAEMDEEQKKYYAAYAMEAKRSIVTLSRERGFERSRIEILAIITRLRQICCHPSLFIENYQGGSGKLNLLLEVVTDALQSGRRILIFSQFTSMLSIIAQMLTTMGISHFYLDGKVKSAQRIEMANAFNDGQNDVFLISLKAGGTGLNLTGADMVIHYDPWWNPAVENQATDRAHRIGQTKAVQVIKLVTKGTIEEKICKLQEKKQAMIDSIVESGETMLSSMTLEEIQSLFD